jgi:pilus assembly protein CpaB
MKIKTSVSLMIALVLGLVTAKVGVDVMRNYKGPTALTSRVVVAKTEMNPGHVIRAEDIDMQVVAVNLVPANALHEVKDVIGRTAVTPIVPGQTMLEALLVARDGGSGLAAVLKPGMRAVAVDVSDSSAVAGMIDRGSKVDVISTFRRGDQTIAKAVVENVEVQSVQRTVSGYARRDGQTTPVENGPVKTVTLLVTPRQASAIELAKVNGGSPRLVLRGTSDTLAGDGQMTDKELLGIEDKVEEVVKTEDIFENLPPPEEKGRPVEIIRGGASSTIYINDRNNEEGTESRSASAQVKPNASGSTRSNARGRGDQ